MKSLRLIAIGMLSIFLLLAISSCTQHASPTITLSSTPSQSSQITREQAQASTVTSSTQATSETGTGAPPTEVITQTATPEPCSPAVQGTLAHIDPCGQNVTWWHQQSGAKGDALAALVLSSMPPTIARSPLKPNIKAVITTSVTK